MHTFWTLDHVACALSARSRGNIPRGRTSLRGISTDTRSIQPGDCFVALSGEHFDAHAFLDQAIEKGAAALVVSHAPALGMYSVPVFVVDDPLLALGDLARTWRKAWGRPVVAVAGSNGKTSTKELVRAALASTYEVHATAGNFNNRIGVPLTLLSIPPTAEFAVVEVGTSLPGEIAILRDIVRPDIAVMTCIAEEHLEGLGDLEGVLREEAAIFDGVNVAITPAVQPEVADAARQRGVRVVSAGLDEGDFHADRWSIAPDGHGTMTFGDLQVAPALRGAHNLRNAMLALAVAQECGVSLDAAARGLATAAIPAMRTSWQPVGRAMVINDAYNANPASMRVAFEMLGAVNSSQRVAVLGTMRELGNQAAEYHDEVARAAIRAPIELIAGVGELGDALRRVAPNDVRVITAADVDELWSALQPRLMPDATILLKASRGVRLERILPHITTWATS